MLKFPVNGKFCASRREEDDDWATLSQAVGDVGQRVDFPVCWCEQIK